jgi:hypothetical protein
MPAPVFNSPLPCTIRPFFPHRSTVKKNKVAPPYKLAEFDILFGSGISANGCLLDAAEAVDVVQKRGSWYYWGETRLAQGRDKTLDVIKESPEMHRWVCGRAGGWVRRGRGRGLGGVLLCGGCVCWGGESGRLQ